MNKDVDLLMAHVDTVLELTNAKLSDEYCYQSLPLCVIDAVYSIGVRYGGVRNVVIRYCDFFGLPRIRPDRKIFPSTDFQESISIFCDKFEACGLKLLAEAVFHNRQRTSARNGILKAEAVYQFALALRTHGIEYLQDVSNSIDNVALEQNILAIAGQRSGISLGYFRMLAGSEEFIKPDRMVLRFIYSALGRDVSLSEAQFLLKATADKLKSKYPHLTARLLDHQVWKFQRSQ